MKADVCTNLACKAISFRPTGAPPPERTGLCACGCGGRTSLARYTKPQRGDVRGQPVRFLPGHSRRAPRDHREEDRGYQTRCWIWRGATNDQGYPLVSIDGRRVYVHRLRWEEAHGPIGPGLQLDHLCRVPSCVRPDHLEAVSPATNTRRGVTAKLTKDDVRVVLERLAAGDAPSQIAADFGVSAGHVRELRRVDTMWADPELQTVREQARGGRR